MMNSGGAEALVVGNGNGGVSEVCLSVLEV